jgi:hypothetical protein
LKESDHAGFIANGDIIEVLEIFNIKELYGFKFANVKLEWSIIQIKTFSVLLLDTIKANPSLTFEESNRLYQEVLIMKVKPSSSNFKKVKANEYFNGLQNSPMPSLVINLKEGRNTVFIEQPYLPNG